MMAHRVGPAGIWWFFLLALALTGLYCASRCLVRHDAGPADRGGHASHALMAAGMTYMFGPVMGGSVIRGLWQAAFAVAAAFFVVCTARAWRRGQSSAMVAPLHHAVSNAAMVYMLAMPSLSVLVITTVLIAYFMVSVLVEGCLLAHRASQGSIRRSWETVTHAGRVLMATAMVFMFAVMDDLASAGLPHHHLG
jgi:hypothetical protein